MEAFSIYSSLCGLLVLNESCGGLSLFTFTREITQTTNTDVMPAWLCNYIALYVASGGPSGDNEEASRSTLLYRLCELFICITERIWSNSLALKMFCLRRLWANAIPWRKPFIPLFYFECSLISLEKDMQSQRFGISLAVGKSRQKIKLSCQHLCEDKYLIKMCCSMFGALWKSQDVESCAEEVEWLIQIKS